VVLAALGKREGERRGTETLRPDEVQVVRSQAHGVAVRAALAGVVLTLAAIALAALLTAPPT
jgi:hypothetical protein